MPVPPAVDLWTREFKGGARQGSGYVQPDKSNRISSAAVLSQSRLTARTAAVGAIIRIIDRIEAAGYADIREVKRERGGYEAKVRDDQGRKVKLYLDPRTGEIINSRARDRRD